MNIENSPLTGAVILRLANLPRRRGERLLRELGITPVGKAGNAKLYPSETVRRLIDAAAKDQQVTTNQ